MASRTVLTKNANLPIIFARSGIFGQVQSFPPRAFNHAQVALFGTQKVIYFEPSCICMGKKIQPLHGYA